jgi:hypothetical protein
MLPGGLIGTAGACQSLGIAERKLRTLVSQYRIRPRRVKYGARYVLGFTPLQIEALRQCL